MKSGSWVFRIARWHHYIATCLIEMVWVDYYGLNVHHLLRLDREWLSVCCLLLLIVLNRGTLKVSAFYGLSFGRIYHRGRLWECASNYLLLWCMTGDAAPKPLLFLLLIACGNLIKVIQFLLLLDEGSICGRILLASEARGPLFCWNHVFGDIW